MTNEQKDQLLKQNALRTEATITICKKMLEKKADRQEATDGDYAMIWLDEKGRYHATDTASDNPRTYAQTLSNETIPLAKIQLKNGKGETTRTKRLQRITEENNIHTLYQTYVEEQKSQDEYMYRMLH